ncbi:MAG: hypothetical protein V1837_01695 [Candidatus Woesearchaeota archaeon]
MTRKTISLSVDDRVHAEYMALCKKNGIVMSKQIENFMQEIINRFRK